MPEDRGLNRNATLKRSGTCKSGACRRVKVDRRRSNSIDDTNRTVIDHTFVDRVVEEGEQCRRFVLRPRIKNLGYSTDAINESEIAILNRSCRSCIGHLPYQFELNVTGFIG